jgi:hypothetical protein
MINMKKSFAIISALAAIFTAISMFIAKKCGRYHYDF